MKKVFRRLLTLLAAGCMTLSAAAAENQKLTLTFTGDVTLGSESWNTEDQKSFVGTQKREGDGYFLANWKEMFMNDDYTVVNLEGVLSDSGMQENKKKQFRFRGSPEYTKILTGSGVDACSICNNHIYDFGAQGYEATKAALAEAGLGISGYENYCMLEKDGVKIAFFSVLQGWYSSNWKLLDEKIAEARAEGANAVVMCVHAGQEYAQKHRERDQGKMALESIERIGADLVIMHHPHVLQGIGVINNRYVCYSLGNFCFGGNVKLKAMDTAVVQADMFFDENHVFQGSQLRIYPAHVSSTAEYNDFCPVAVTGDEAESALDKIRYDSDENIPILYDEEAGCAVLPYLPAEGGFSE